MGVNHRFFWNPTNEEVGTGVKYVAEKYESAIDPDRLKRIMQRLLELFHFYHFDYLEAQRQSLEEHGLGEPSVEREVFKSAIHAGFKSRRERGRKRYAHPGTKEKKPAPAEPVMPALPEDMEVEPPLLALIALDVANRQRHEHAEERALYGLPDNCDPL